jgi:hypothetical protein
LSARWFKGPRKKGINRVSPATQRATKRHAQVFMVNAVTSSRPLTLDADNRIEMKPVN